MNKQKAMSWIQKGIPSLLFFVAFVIHTFFSKEYIDTISIILLVLVCFPWFLHHLKMIELTGLGKIELLDNEDKDRIAKEADSLVEEVAGEEPFEKNSGNDFLFEVFRNDMQLGLAGIRIELEKIVNQLKTQYNVAPKPGPIGLGSGIRDLEKVGAISLGESSLLREVTSILNRAVHGASELSNEDANWAYDVGSQMVSVLKSKLKQQEIANDGRNTVD
ncbi:MULTISPECIES: hypothetical protein [Gordonibacter]|uniref:DUF4145 domain-containing protein n=1 Tax=Gordonibacter faecis TaxID=3047475 RepID=A0ABT7DQG5_9ACTN|nr:MULTISPECIES: hypothetical protein [unclassified Gordonibacter]MDJ1651794.1 hypothetical protein [Gordonibacter sp. KGMB12511]HIW75672.1 hypothetical protein [Candidatus Gordonibacter avicola]